MKIKYILCEYLILIKAINMNEVFLKKCRMEKYKKWRYRTLFFCGP